MLFQVQDQQIQLTHAARQHLLDHISNSWKKNQGFALATLNLDHLVKLEHSADFRRAYGAHDIIVADGNPIVWLAKLAKKQVELIPGSDLIGPLCQLAAQSGVPVCLIGTTAQALHYAQATLTKRHPGLSITFCHAPPMGFDPNGPDAVEILEQVSRLGPCLCLLALGAPKQELLAALGRKIAPQAGFASIGAGLDFISGTQKRAPKWVRAVAMEWAFRAATAPRRLIPRYLACFKILPRQIRAAVAQRRN